MRAQIATVHAKTHIERVVALALSYDTQLRTAGACKDVLDKLYKSGGWSLGLLSYVARHGWWCCCCLGHSSA